MATNKDFLIHYYQNFNVLTPVEIEEIVSKYELITVERDHILQKEGKISKYSYLVEKGLLIDYVYNQDGEMQVLNFIPEKYWAGGGINYNVHGVYTKSIENSKLFRIESAVLESFYTKNKEVAFLEVKLLRMALKAMKQRMLNSISKPALYNYQQLLLKFPDIEQRASQKLISSYLGVTPQFFSKMKANYLKNS